MKFATLAPALLFISFTLCPMDLTEKWEFDTWKPGISQSWKPWESEATQIMEEYVREREEEEVAEQSLEQMYAEDQGIRKQLLAKENLTAESKKYCNFINKTHVSLLKPILEKFGWPTNKDHAHTAWLIALHADHDPEFQAEALHYLKTAQTPAATTQWAYLLDRILVNSDRAQHFGTQCDDEGNILPIHGYHFDPHNEAETELQLEVVNNRREAIGLPSLQEYTVSLMQIFRNPQAAQLTSPAQ